MDWIDFTILVGTGLIAGSWGALIGAGGGFIMVPLLLFLRSDLSAAEVTAVSLVAVFANGVSGAIAYARLSRIDYRSGLVFLVAMLPGGVAGALLVNHIGKGLFQAIFGTLLVLVALYVFARPRRPTGVASASRGTPRRVVDVHGTVYEYKISLKLGTGITSLVGLLASTLGIGGGIFNVPSFVYILGLPLQVATATSQFMVMGTSAVATITNLLEGDLWGLWSIALALTLGTVVGAQVGARVSQHLSTGWVARILATGLLLVGARLVIGGTTSF